MGKSISKDNSIDERLLEAARNLFTVKGYANTNMREIAGKAGVNKGLIHYYNWSKSKLFFAVFAEAFRHFAMRANALFASDKTLPGKIEAFIDSYMSFLLSNPELPGFVISELNSNPEAFMEQLLGRIDPLNPVPFVEHFKTEVEAGNIRQTDPLHFFLNLLSMCVFPFLARPMFQTFFHLSSEEYDDLLKSRKKEVLDFALAGLYAKGRAPDSGS